MKGISTWGTCAYCTGLLVFGKNEHVKLYGTGGYAHYICYQKRKEVSRKIIKDKKRSLGQTKRMQERLRAELGIN